MIDVRFPTVLQMMLNLALAQERGEEPVTSARLARSLGANRSLVRTMLVPLSHAGLVVSSLGKKGGSSLARPASQISLREVYEAVVGDKPLWSPRGDIPSVCVVSSNIGQYFETVSDWAEEAALSALAQHSLADGLTALHALDAARTKTKRPAASRPPVSQDRKDGLSRSKEFTPQRMS